jgi:hypothetical protein
MCQLPTICPQDQYNLVDGEKREEVLSGLLHVRTSSQEAADAGKRFHPGARTLARLLLYILAGTYFV